jgi:hypothetical protein
MPSFHPFCFHLSLEKICLMPIFIHYFSSKTRKIQCAYFSSILFSSKPIKRWMETDWWIRYIYDFLGNLQVTHQQCQKDKWGIGGSGKEWRAFTALLIRELLPCISLVSFTNLECSLHMRMRSSQSYVAMSHTSSCNSPKVLYFSLSLSLFLWIIHY